MAFERKDYMKLKHDFKGEQPHLLTNTDLFADIISWARENIPEYQEVDKILDYSLSDNENWTVPYEDSVAALVNTGGSEGVYLDVFFCRCDKKHRFMVFKTLDDSMDAYIRMGMLAGIITAAVENYQYQNEENLLKWEA